MENPEMDKSEADRVRSAFNRISKEAGAATVRVIMREWVNARVAEEPAPGILIVDDAPHFSIGRIEVEIESLIRATMSGKLIPKLEAVIRETVKTAEIMNALKERLLASVKS